jgi:predicted RNase H-like HicB family nuclease
MQQIAYTVHTFKEGSTFVAYVPELDLSSCGRTGDDARRNIRDAVAGFVEASAAKGTLELILEEAGYQRNGDSWIAPEFVALDRDKVSV